ncbi:hypothetical protein HK104_003803, partial [Borealophlyctis nickersoniae]
PTNSIGLTRGFASTKSFPRWKRNSIPRFPVRSVVIAATSSSTQNSSKRASSGLSPWRLSSSTMAVATTLGRTSGETFIPSTGPATGTSSDC